MASKFNAGGVYITFDGDDKPLNKTLKSIQGNIEGKLTGAIMKFGQAFAAAFAVKKIASFMKESQKLYKVQEQAEVKLAQLMKNAGKYTKENFNEMKAYAGELQKLSNYGDEFVMPIIADLSKAKLSTEQLKEATKATLDIMAAGGDAGMLSRVLEKPLEMSGALHRMGILINKEELKGLTLEQQRSKVLDEVNKKYGGMAEVMADPLTQIRNAIGDLKEKFGKTFDNFIGKNSDKIKNLINRISDSIQPTLDNITIILDAAVLTVQKVSKILEPLITKLSGLFKEFSKLIGKTLSDSNLAKNWESYIENLQGGYRVDELRATYKNKDTGAVDRALIKQAIQEAIDKNNKAKEKSDYGLVNNLIAAMNKYGNRDVNDPNQFVGHDRLGNKVTDTEEYIRKFLTTQDYSDWTTKFVIEEMLKKVKADDKDLYKELKRQYDQILKQRKKFGQIVENTHLDEINKQLEDTLADLASFDNGTLDEKTDKILNRTGGNNSKEFFGLDKFIESINKSMMEEEDAVTKAKNELTKQMQELIEQGEADGKTLKNGAKQAAENAIEAYSVWNGIDSVTNDFKTLASQTNISVEEYSKSLSELGGKYQELLKKQEKIRKKINNEADKLSGKQKEMLERTIADNDRKLKDLAAAAIEAAENFVEIFFEPLKELETQANNSIGSISGGSVASFYSTNKKAKTDIANYSAAADKTHKDTLSKIYDANNGMTQEERTAAKLAADTRLKEAAATAEQMEATRKATATTEAFTLAMSLAADALNTVADSIANNLEAEGDSERAADVREGAQIVSDSVNNFLQGFAQGGPIMGPIMGLVMMIIGWIKELLERMGKYLHSLEAIFVSVSKAFDTVAAIVSPIASALEILLSPLTILTEMMNSFMDLFRPFFELMADIVDSFVKAIVKPFQNVFKPVIDSINKVFGGIREALGIGDLYEGNFDELVENTEAIANQVKAISETLDKATSAMSSINSAIKNVRDTVSKLVNTGYNKKTVAEIYNATLKTIEDQKLFKDSSVDLNLYKSLIDENGKVNQDIANRLLTKLEYSELDANDFYADMGDKLKDLVSKLSQYQEEEDNGYDSIEKSVKDIISNQQTLQEQEKELKGMLADGGLDNKQTESIKSALQTINTVNTSINDFKKEMGGSGNADSATILEGIKKKIGEVSTASDENAATLNAKYFGEKSSLGKLENSSNLSLTVLESLVRDIRDELLKANQEATAAARKKELYEVFKQKIQNKSYNLNELVDKNAALKQIEQTLNELDAAYLADDSVYKEILSNAKNTEFGAVNYWGYGWNGQVGSWDENEVKTQNTQALIDDATKALLASGYTTLGEMRQFFMDSSGSAEFVDQMAESIKNGGTPIYDFDNGNNKPEVFDSRTLAAINDPNRTTAWNALCETMWGTSYETDGKWKAVREVLNRMFYNHDTGVSGSLYKHLSESEWALVKKAFDGSYDWSAIEQLKKSNEAFKIFLRNLGYNTGGWTGNIPIDKISGFVHGQEYVVKAPYAADYRPMLEAINEGRGSSIFGNQSALQNVNINIDSTIRANDPLSMINEWNKELRNRNLRLELKKV